MSEIGNRIKQRRLGLGYTQERVAGGVLSVGFISRIESGDKRPGLDALLNIADSLQTTALYLLLGTEDVLCPMCKKGTGGKQ